MGEGKVGTHEKIRVIMAATGQEFLLMIGQVNS